MITILTALYKAIKESRVNNDFQKAIYYTLEAITGILFIITFIIICYLILK